MKKLVPFLFLLLPVLLKAQDAHYWGSNFSPAGFLTPGAAIVNTLDSGVVYLNPAVMAWSDKTATSISSSIYQYDYVKIKNGVGTGKNLVSNNTKIIPQLISKTFKLNKDHPLTIGFALIQNPMQDFQTSQRQDKKANVLSDSYSPGDEVYVGQFDAQNRTTETYAQLSVGKRLTSKLAAGITVEGMLRRAETSSNFSSRALFNTNNDPDVIFPPIARYDLSYRTDYIYAGLRVKLGLSYDSGPHHLGMLLSSPLAKLFTRGEVISDFNIANLISDNDVKNPYNLLASTRQDKLRATYKMPMSLAMGYAYDYDLGQVYIAVEYFGSVNPYSILKPDDISFIKTGNAPATQNSGALNLTDGRRRVMNIGLGYSRAINDVFTLMSSVRTDFNYLDPKMDDQGHISLWDNYHAQLGGNFKRRKFNLRAGLLLTYGRTGNYNQPVNFDNVSDQNLLMGVPGTVPAKHFTTGLLISYVHNF